MTRVGSPRRDGKVRRCIDVVVSLVLLIVTSPLLVGCAAAVRLVMGPPVLFRQRRTGKAGQEFTILKLRTMRAARRPDELDDDRTSGLGRFLRSTSLDELPQLLNVLRGEMSLIGPRPTLPEQVAAYGPRERRRLEVLPGLTGWAQVNGRNAISWPERIELDLQYIDHWSIRLDLIIVARTVRRLVRMTGITGQGGVNPGYPGSPGRSGGHDESGPSSEPDDGSTPAR